MIPYEKTCSAEQDTIKKMMASLKDKYFSENSEKKSFSIVPQVTNNINYHKSTCIEIITSQIEKPHYINYKTPDFYILIFVCKMGVSVSFVSSSHYNSFAKFNVRLVQDIKPDPLKDNNENK
eukprot:TRINITY_DN1832_c0_g1_i1.p2 TRINITY_DN1832_c0_g1~~TRINITY_DN1832_c0_g1_i1.p2  ORF type:complete len:122 (-),score=45.66 TRINITY_DN1832_c0_g1_i1:14-379(-)